MLEHANIFQETCLYSDKKYIDLFKWLKDMCTKLNSSFELESVSISKHVPPQEHVATLCNSFLLSDDGDRPDKRKWACRWTGWLQKSWGTVLDRNNKCSGTARTDVYLILNRKDICISINNPSCIVRNAQLCYETQTARASERERAREAGRQTDRQRQTDIHSEEVSVTDGHRERETDWLIELYYTRIMV